jgi:hypothetical protein
MQTDKVAVSQEKTKAEEALEMRMEDDYVEKMAESNRTNSLM